MGAAALPLQPRHGHWRKARSVRCWISGHRAPLLGSRVASFDGARSSALALGFTRVNGTRSPRRKPGDSGWHAFPGAVRRGFEPGNCVPSSGRDGGVVFVPGVPGFPPGASWTDDETDSRCKGPAKRRSQPDSCSGDALSSHSAQHRNPQAEPALLRGPGLLPDHHAARRTLHPPHAAAKRQPIQRPCCCQVGATAQKTFSPSLINSG